MQENFTILNQGAALERPTFPIKLLILSSRTLPRCYSGLPQKYTELFELCETFLNDHLFKKDEEFKPDAVETARKRESKMKMELLNTPKKSPHLQSRCGMLNHTGG